MLFAQMHPAQGVHSGAAAAVALPSTVQSSIALIARGNVAVAVWSAAGSNLVCFCRRSYSPTVTDDLNGTRNSNQTPDGTVNLVPGPFALWSTSCDRSFGNTARTNTLRRRAWRTPSEAPVTFAPSWSLLYWGWRCLFWPSDRGSR